MKGDPPILINFDDHASKLDFIRRAGRLKGVWEVQFQRPTKPRTLKSNRYYFVAVIGEALYYFRDTQGEPSITSTEAHTMLKIQVLGITERVNKETGQVMLSVPDTHTMTQEEFNNYVDSAAKWLAEQGIVVVSSEDYWDEKQKSTKNRKVKT